MLEYNICTLVIKIIKLIIQNTYTNNAVAIPTINPINKPSKNIF